MGNYIENFQKLGFGIFVHYGLYSQIGRGEWIRYFDKLSLEEYEKANKGFHVNKNWAKEIVSVAKKAGAKYVCLTTRHHDGFSLYDTRGINDYDAPHRLGRDLVQEFVNECRKQDMVPFFYHTLLDWYNTDYENNFPKYEVMTYE